jgi:hypothetical protein
MVDWLTLLLRIRQVPGSNLGLETDFTEFLLGCPQSLQENSGILL